MREVVQNIVEKLNTTLFSMDTNRGHSPYLLFEYGRGVPYLYCYMFVIHLKN